MMIIDASEAAAGRVASLAAKQLLKGAPVSIVNAEQAVISGNPAYTIKTFREKIVRGDPYHGPFQPKRPDRILKRMVRGMMPHRRPAGRAAYKTLRVYMNVPEDLQGKDFQTLPKGQGMTLEKLSSRL